MSAARPLLLAALLAGAFAAGVWWLERAPQGPVEPVWDKQRCAHCGMAVSDPRFAAEIQTRDRRVLFFDDPGCLRQYEKDHHPEERAVYFHHSRDPRWMPASATGFVPAAGTPMNWGFAAVDAEEASHGNAVALSH